MRRALLGLATLLLVGWQTGNFIETTLASGITAGSPTVVISAVPANLAAMTITSSPAYAVLEQGSRSSPTRQEIVLVTARSGTTLSITRAQDGTSAQAFNAGDRISFRLVRGMLHDLRDRARPAGSTPQVQYNNSGAFGGAAQTEIRSGNLALVETSTPAPVSGRAVLSASVRAFPGLWATPDSGDDYPIGAAPWAWRQQWSCRPRSSGAYVDCDNLTLSQLLDAPPAFTNGSLLSSTVRVGMTAGPSDSGIQQAGCTGTTVFPFWRGDSAGLGGFHFISRWGVAGVVAGDSWLLAGFTSNSASYGLTSTHDPVTRTGDAVAYVAMQRGTTALVACTNDGAGAPTCSALPNMTVATGAVFEIHIFAEPNGSTVEFWVRELTSGRVATASRSTDLPPATTFMRMCLLAVGNGVNNPVDTAFDVNWINGYVSSP